LEAFLDDFSFVFAIIDVQGAITMKKVFPEAFVIFLRPGSINDVKNRLESERMGVPQKEIASRIETAAYEMSLANHFDAILENFQGNFDQTLAGMLALINNEIIVSKNNPF